MVNAEQLDDQLQHREYPANEEEFKQRILGCCETTDEREALDELSLAEWMEIYLPARTLVGVSWEAWGSPMGGFDTIELLALGKHAYFFVPPDYAMGTHDLLFLGKTTTPMSPSVVSEFVRDQLSDLLMGWTDSDGDAIWPNRLPTGTENYAPELVSREAIRDAYHSVLDTGVKFRWGSAGISLLEDLAHIAGDAWLAQWTEGRSIKDLLTGDAPGDLRARNEIFEEWFRRTYREFGVAT